MASSSRQARRRQQQQAARRVQHRNNNKLFLILGSLVVVGVLAAVLIGSALANKSPGSGNNSSSNTVAPVIDGIKCDPQERVTYHKHAKLTIYVKGKLYAVPPFVGISDQYGCLYYLHVHPGYDQGTIHMEFPYTPKPKLKQFLDVWHATRPDQDAPVATIEKGGPNVRFFVNGKPFHGTAANLVLAPHTEITVDIGKPIKIAPAYTWPQGV